MKAPRRVAMLPSRNRLVSPLERRNTVTSPVLPHSATYSVAVTVMMLAAAILGGADASRFTSLAPSSVTVTTVQAQFNYPSDIIFDPMGDGTSYFVADSHNHQIQKVTPTASNRTSVVVTRFAGTTQGSSDGPALSASFYYPFSGVVLMNALYIADAYNYCVRRIPLQRDGTGGVTTTIASFSARTYGIASDPFRNRTLYVSQFYNHYIFKLTLAEDGSLSTKVILAGTGSAGADDGPPSSAQFYFPRGMMIDPFNKETLYVAEQGNHRIRKITLSSAGDAVLVSTVAGTTAGYSDGPLNNCLFNQPASVAIDPSDNNTLYIADEFNHRIRRINLKDSIVSTLTGNGVAGLVDGRGSEVEHYRPCSFTVAFGVAFVADHANHRVRLLLAPTQTASRHRFSPSVDKSLTPSRTGETTASTASPPLSLSLTAWTKGTATVSALHASITVVLSASSLVSGSSRMTGAATRSDKPSVTRSGPLSLTLAPLSVTSSCTLLRATMTTQGTPSLLVSRSRSATAVLPSSSVTRRAPDQSASASRSLSWRDTTGSRTVTRGTQTCSRSTDTTATACVATGVLGLLLLASNATVLFSSPSPVLGASVRFDDMRGTPLLGEAAVVLAVGGAGLVGAWTLASLAVGSTRVTVANSSSGEGVAYASFALPVEGWPGLQPQRPYALQHVDIAAVLVCGRQARNVSVLVEVRPRPVPVADTVAVLVQSSQGAAVASGGADALAVGRMATTVVVLPCEDFLSGGAVGSGYGIGVVALTDKYHPAVDTIAGNLVFVLCLVSAALLFSVCLHAWARHTLSVDAVMRDVLRLPSSLLPVMAATLPTSVMAFVAVMRDRPAGSAIAYVLAFVVAVMWGGCLALACVALIRCRRLLVARPRAVLSGAVTASCAERLVRAVTAASVEWSLVADEEDEPSTDAGVAALPQHAEQCIALVEGLRVAWFTPADLGSSLLMAVVSALPLSESRALCAAVASINTVVSAAMLMAVTVLRPFSTAIGSAHSVVMAVATTVNASCVLACVALGPGGSVATVTLLSAAIQYSSAAAATLALVKTAVDVVTFAVVVRRRLEAAVTLATKRAVTNAALSPSIDCDGGEESMAHEDDESTLLDFLTDLRVDDGPQGPSLLDEILSPGDHAVATDLMMAYNTRQSDAEEPNCSGAVVDLGLAHHTTPT